MHAIYLFSSRDMFPCLCLIYPGCQVQARSCDVPSGPGPTTQGRLRPPQSGADPLQQCPGRIPGCAGEAAAARPSGHDAGPEENVCRGGGKKGRVCGRRDRESQGSECSSRRRRIISPSPLTHFLIATQVSKLGGFEAASTAGKWPALATSLQHNSTFGGVLRQVCCYSGPHDPRC